MDICIQAGSVARIRPLGESAKHNDPGEEDRTVEPIPLTRPTSHRPWPSVTPSAKRGAVSVCRSLYGVGAVLFRPATMGAVPGHQGEYSTDWSVDGPGGLLDSGRAYRDGVESTMEGLYVASQELGSCTRQ